MKVLKNHTFYSVSNACRKLKGSGFLIIAIATAIMVAVMSFSVTRLNQLAYRGFGNSKIMLQAQQYAESEAAIIKATNYSDLTAHNKAAIQNSNGFYSEITLSAESAYSESIKQRNVLINIYKDNEVLPRYSLRVVRLSKDSSSTLPAGSIISWFGPVANIPDGFLLCDGNNGTPDLRNRFIVGAGNAYALSATGGADTVKLSAAQMPSHYHYHGYNYSSNGGMWPRLSSAIQPNYPTGAIATKWNGSGGGNWNGWDSGGASYLLSNLITSLPYDNSSGTTAHENRPPYYALYYIMKT